MAAVLLRTKIDCAKEVARAMHKAFVGTALPALPTPCLAVDVDLFDRNLTEMQKMAAAAGKVLRPHSKAHKSSAVAKLQVVAGACGVTVAKLSEASAMLEGGVKSVLITSPIVDPKKVAEGVRLSKQYAAGPGEDLTTLSGSCSASGPDVAAAACGEGLTFTVDSVATAAALGVAAAAYDCPAVSVIVEIDCGQERTGAPLLHAAAIAAGCALVPRVRVVGLQRYPGHLQHVEDVKTRMDASAAIVSAGAEVFRQIAGAAVAGGVREGEHWPMSLRPQGVDCATESLVRVVGDADRLLSSVEVKRAMERVAKVAQSDEYGAAAVVVSKIGEPDLEAKLNKYRQEMEKLVSELAGASVEGRVRLLAQRLRFFSVYTGGGTGTFLGDLKGPLTELQPGSYCLMDEDYRVVGGLPPSVGGDAPPLRVVASVLGVPPSDRGREGKEGVKGVGASADERERAESTVDVGCVDVGLKGMYKDGPAPKVLRRWRSADTAVDAEGGAREGGEPWGSLSFLEASGGAAGRELLRDECQFEWRGDEHGFVMMPAAKRSGGSGKLRSFEAGDVLELSASHIDPTVSLHDFIFVVKEEGGVPRVVDVWPIDARGCHW